MSSFLEQWNDSEPTLGELLLGGIKVGKIPEALKVLESLEKNQDVSTHLVKQVKNDLLLKK